MACNNSEEYMEDAGRCMRKKCSERKNIVPTSIDWPCGRNADSEGNMCYADTAAGEEVCAPACSNGNHYKIDPTETGRCVLRNCTNRTENTESIPCGSNCFLDGGCVLSCTNPALYKEDIVSGRCVLRKEEEVKAEDTGDQPPRARNNIPIIVSIVVSVVVVLTVTATVTIFIVRYHQKKNLVSLDVEPKKTVFLDELNTEAGAGMGEDHTLSMRQAELQKDQQILNEVTVEQEGSQVSEEHDIHEAAE